MAKSRRLKLDPLNPDAERATNILVLLRNLSKIAHVALNRERSWVKDGHTITMADPDCATSVKCQELQARLIGCLDPSGSDDELKKTQRDLVALLKRSKIAIVREAG